VDGIIAISRAVAGVLAAAGVPEERIRVVHSGVEPPEIPPGARERVRAELVIEGDRTLIGTVAALTDHKGHRYLLEAIPPVVERHPEALFLLVGEGELRGELERQAGSLGLGSQHLRFLGQREDVPAILGALDLFVLPSHMEGLGTAIVDAQMAGLPVVATRAGGIPEIVLDGVTGLLAEPRDPACLAERILTMLDDAALRARLAGAGRRRAMEHFSADAMVDGTLAAWREFLARSG